MKLLTVEHSQQSLSAIEAANADLEKCILASHAHVRIQASIEADKFSAKTELKLVDDRQPSYDCTLEAVTVFTWGHTSETSVIRHKDDIIENFIARSFRYSRTQKSRLQIQMLEKMGIK